MKEQIIRHHLGNLFLMTMLLQVAVCHFQHNATAATGALRTSKWHTSSGSRRCSFLAAASRRRRRTRGRLTGLIDERTLAGSRGRTDSTSCSGSAANRDFYLTFHSRRAEFETAERGHKNDSMMTMTMCGNRIRDNRLYGIGRVAVSSSGPGRPSCRRYSTYMAPPPSCASSDSINETPENRERQRLLQPPPLLDPKTLHNGTIPYPKSLSPSSIMEFKKCPQSYLFQYLYGFKQPTNRALAMGTMCHSALERIFDLQPRERTLLNLQNLLRVAWSEKRNLDPYKHLFASPSLDDTETSSQDYIDPVNVTTRASLEETDIQAEREWGQAALQLLANYYAIEDPRYVTKPNPLEREVWVNATLTVDPTLGVTGYMNHRGRDTLSSSSSPPSLSLDHNDDISSDSSSSSSSPSKFLVRGIIDRIDLIRFPPPSSNMIPNHNHNIDQEAFDKQEQYGLRLIDYKTGKAPNFNKYSRAVNERIAEENFYQLKMYALLLREMVASGTAPSNILHTGLDLRMLRLFYLTSSDNDRMGMYLDMDLGPTREGRDAILQDVHVDVSNVWLSIRNLVHKQDPRVFVHCDRKFCFCHKLRPKFVKGSVWEEK